MNVVLKEMPCLCCGTCCRRWQAPLDEEELQELCRNLDTSREEFTSDYLDPRGLKHGMLLLRHGADGCIFLRKENSKSLCGIHRFKPAACRNWAPSLSHRECAEGTGAVLADPGQ